MGEIITTVTIVILLLIAVCFIGSLSTRIKKKSQSFSLSSKFTLHFGLLKGFDISGSFFEHNSREEQQ